MVRSLVCVAACLTLACSRSSSNASDAGLDAPSPELDAAVDASAVVPDSGSDAGACLENEPSDVPELRGGFRVRDADGGMATPTGLGGNPAGVWTFDRLTFWVRPEAATMFDPDASTVHGRAWASFVGDQVQLSYSFVTRLAGTVAGTITRPNTTIMRGVFRQDGADIQTLPYCGTFSSEPQPDAAVRSANLSFTQSGDTIMLISELSGGADGDLVLVLEGTRRSP
jgi:hypothetical protein